MNWRATAGAVALALGPGGAAADTTAALYDGGGNLGNWNFTVGWFFTPGQDLGVTQLGVYDLGAPGFASAHNVGIFRAFDQSLVVSGSLGAGQSGDLIDGSRFVDVAAAVLEEGIQYYIVADNFMTDQYAFGAGAVTFAPDVAWQGFAQGFTNDISGTVLNLGGSEGNVGPNFRFFVIPAPGSAALLGLAALGAGRRRR